MTDLLLSMDPTTLAVLWSVSLGALSMGGYVGLNVLSERTDRRAERRRAGAQRRYVGVARPDAAWPGHHR